MNLGLAALHPDGSCSNSQQKSRMAASDVIPDVRIDGARVLDWQSELQSDCFALNYRNLDRHDTLFTVSHSDLHAAARYFRGGGVALAVWLGWA